MHTGPSNASSPSPFLKRRRVVLLSSVASAAGLLSGCITTALFEDKHYSESVSAVLISSDDRKLVFIGKDYHYIFDAPPVLVQSLRAGFHQALGAQIDTFHVDGSGKITGQLRLILGLKASEADKQAALALGYRKFDILKAGYGCDYALTLVGQRYDAGGIEPKLSSQQLNTRYQIQVIAEQSTGEKAAKSLLTPITISADGILIIGMIPLVLIGATVFTAVVATECHAHPDCFK